MMITRIQRTCLRTVVVAQLVLAVGAPAAMATSQDVYDDWASDGTINETYTDAELRGVLEIADAADLEYYNLEEQVNIAIAAGKGGTVTGTKPRKSSSGQTLPPESFEGDVVGPGSSNDPGDDFGSPGDLGGDIGLLDRNDLTGGESSTGNDDPFGSDDGESFGTGEEGGFYDPGDGSADAADGNEEGQTSLEATDDTSAADLNESNSTRWVVLGLLLLLLAAAAVGFWRWDRARAMQGRSFMQTMRTRLRRRGARDEWAE